MNLEHASAVTGSGDRIRVVCYGTMCQAQCLERELAVLLAFACAYSTPMMRV